MLHNWLLLFFFSCIGSLIPLIIVGQGSVYNAYRDHPLVLQADSFFTFENYQAARQTFEYAKKELQDDENWAGYVYALNRLGRSYVQLEQFDQAYRVLQEADREGKLRVDGKHVERGRTLNQLGYYHGIKGNDSLANLHFNHALNLLRGCCQDSPEALGELYLDYARFLNNKEDPKVREMAELSVHHFGNKFLLQPNFRMAEACTFLAYMLWMTGDTDLGFDYISRAKGILQSTDKKPFSLLIQTNEVLAGLYNAKDDPNQSILYYQDNIDLLKDKQHPLSKKITYYLFCIGTNYIDMQNSAAIDYLSQAKEFELSQENPEKFYIAAIHELFGRHYRNVGQPDLAIINYNKALDLYDPSWVELVSNATQGLAEAYLLMNDPQNALQMVDHSLELVGFDASKVIDATNLKYENIDILFEPLELRGRILYHLYHKSKDEKRLSESLNAFLNIEKIAEQTRSGRYSEGTQRVVSEHFYRGAKGALRSLHTLYKISPKPNYAETAFEFMEHNRYAELYQNLEKASAAHSIGVPNSILQKEKYFISLMEKLRREKQVETNQDNLNTLEDSLLQLQTAYRNFRDDLAAKYPAYYQIKYDSMLSLEAVQQQLNPVEQIFEYFWGDSVITLVSICVDTLFMDAVPIQKIEADLNRILRWIVSSYPPDSLGMNYNSYAQRSYNLYSHLVAPYLQPGTERMIVSADGDLAFLPFETLISDKSNNNFKTAAYLIQDQEIQYTHSCNLLYKTNSHEPIKQPQVLAMSYSNEDEGQTSSDGLVEIPYSGKEVNAVRNNFKRANVSQLKGPGATKTAFKRRIQDYDVVHLAVHGVGDTLSPLNSHLIFNSDNDSLDSKLYAHELYNLPISRLRLAVLSACETGVGKNYEGEGVFSIARGFSYIGTPSLIMSLWNVNDESTEMIFSNFYRHLNKGLSPTDAMRKAKIDYLERSNGFRCKPYFWSSFIQIGDSVPLTRPPNSLWILWLVLVALISLGLYLKFK